MTTDGTNISRASGASAASIHDDVDREEFYARLNEIHKNKSLNAFHLQKDEYFALIYHVKLIRSNAIKKEPADFRKQKRFEVINTSKGERLFKPTGPEDKHKQMYVYVEEIYDIIRSYHLKLNHGGRTRMMIEIKKGYRNITTESVLLYISLCRPCKLKLVKKRHFSKSHIQKVSSNDGIREEIGLHTVVENISVEESVSEHEIAMQPSMPYPELYSRGQIDLLDVSTNPDGYYKYMMVYRDLVHKYIHLKPLAATNVFDTVDALLEIYLVYGAPNILQSKNGITVVKAICKRIQIVCPDIKIVTSECIVPGSDLKEKSNVKILRKMNSWVKANPHSKWHQGLKFIQNELNTKFNETFCKSPHEIIFGSKPYKGIASFMSQESFENIETEDDLKLVLEAKENNTLKTNQVFLEECLIQPESFIKMEV